MRCRFRELGRAMRTTRRLDRNLHRARGTIFRVDGFFGWMSKLIDNADNKKYRDRNDQEVDHEGNEVAVVPSDCSSFRRIGGSIESDRSVFGGPQKEELV